MFMPLLAAAAAILVPGAAAQAAGPLQVTTHLLVEHRVARPDGTVRVDQVPATRALPGDRVTVVVAYRNTGTATLSGVVIGNPVPHGLTFRGGAGAAAEMSVDGARFAPLGALRMPVPTGAARPARAEDVTALRWRVPTPLAPGAAGRFSFDASIQ